MKSTDIPCAIYTRKSSEEGLEQEFNSLEAASPGATPVKPGASLAPAPANDLLATAQQLADEEGISLEEALQAVKDAQSED